MWCNPFQPKWLMTTGCSEGQDRLHLLRVEPASGLRIGLHKRHLGTARH